MFHHSTTLHHSHTQFSGFTGRESRVVHMAGLGKVAEWRLKGAVAWDYLRGPRKLARLYSWSFGWPLIKKGADLGVQGMGKAADGAEWTGYAATEVAKGAGQMTISPLAMLAYSRLVAIKRLAFWDVPIKTLGAVVKTPFALLKSPWNFLKGVGESIGSVRGNISELFNSVRNYKLMDTLKNTRKAITDVILPPITKPLTPIVAPAVDLVGTAIGAEWQTVSTARTAISEVIPNGARRIRHAPDTASAILAQKKIIRETRKAALEQEAQEKRDALKAQVAEVKGEAAPGGGGAKKAASGK
ncbi:hypothetical protein JXD20_02340 [Candidatus Peregrinibacteria bacterium]|nr:hypothetical protein [Candidatus Peregrinibacteria bacterium]